MLTKEQNLWSIKDYFLNTTMDQLEYMKVSYKHIPPNIKTHYNLNAKVTENGYIYIKIKKGMYGLHQAAILAYQYLQQTSLEQWDCGSINIYLSISVSV